MFSVKDGDFASVLRGQHALAFVSQHASIQMKAALVARKKLLLIFPAPRVAALELEHHVIFAPVTKTV